MITQDSWSYISEQDERIQITGSDTLHQVWSILDNQSRIGYKVYLPDGTVIFPETMISNDVWSAYSTSCIVNQDSVALFWREGVPIWYSLRDSAGSGLVAASFLSSDYYVNRPRVEAASDSLGRIHCVFEISAGVCYAVFDPGTGEMLRDTIPESYPEISNICVDGNRVHIFYTTGYDLPAYIQYDLAGTIVIPPVELVQELDFFYPQSSVTVDNDGNFWCFLRYSREGVPGIFLSLVKIDGESGAVLLEQEVETPNQVGWFMNIMPGPGGDTLYLMWLAYFQSDHYVYFSILDKDGNFIEEPYPAYDYSDEEVQNLTCLDATINADGDVYAIWSQGDVQVGGYWIVLGWLDHNWVGVEHSETEPFVTEMGSIHCSSNPFEESVLLTLSGIPATDQLLVFNTSGRLVRTLESSDGSTFLWDGFSSEGEEAPSGLYMVIPEDRSIKISAPVVKLD
ncbi:MAG TPA: hypothetical protein PLM22_11455 [Candidatus Sabulitectum sp.]|nr:hypothetical protein [Candidatus Sabulitectum sp.]HPJ29540.1 hypothetical protein [Candidatus Sabulitectum sp.]